MNTEKLTIFEKLQKFSWAIILFLVLVITVQTCNTSKRVSAIKDKVDTVPTREEISRQIQIEGLKTSKRTLFDWNSVIRTVKRPDDLMNSYDSSIEKLETKKVVN
jgi:ribosomal silencing factor RsfS